MASRNWNTRKRWQNKSPSPVVSVAQRNSRVGQSTASVAGERTRARGMGPRAAPGGTVQRVPPEGPSLRPLKARSRIPRRIQKISALLRMTGRAPRTENGRVFGPQTVCRARVAASNKLRVTSSHSMQPTSGSHRWHVHIPTYGRSVASKPAAIACDRGASPPCSSDRIECSAAVYGLYK